MGQNPNQLEIDSMEMAEHVREVHDTQALMDPN